MDNNDRSGWQPEAGTVAPVVATEPAPEPPRPPSRRGFAAMSPELQRALASRGGKASHASHRGHEWSREEAREAGRKGGKASRTSKPRGGSSTG